MADEPEIVDDKEQSRYEAHLGGETVAIADYVKAHGGSAKIGIVGALNSFIQNQRLDGFKAAAGAGVWGATATAAACTRIGMGAMVQFPKVLRRRR